MTLRPCDASGDVLPVRASEELLTGPEAVVAALKYRLTFWAGEWWENPEEGNRVLQMMEAARLTAEDGPALVSYFSAYVAECPEVVAVEDAEVALTGRTLTFSCRVITSSGEAPLNYSVSF